MEKKQAGRIDKSERIRFKFGIDRDLENREVLEFRKTRNERLFEQLFKRRTPTIQYLARKYKWLSEDAFSEISVVFVRTVNRYGKNGRTTDFNTFFFSSVKNHFSNVAKKKFRKKRTTFDGCDPALRSIPLDSCIDDGNDAPLFHELITTQEQSGGSNHDRLVEYVKRICEGNDFLCTVLMDFLDFTRRQIVRRKHTVSYRCPLITGDLYEDICKGVDIPQTLFEVENASVDNGEIACNLALNTRPLLSFLAEKFAEKDVVLDTIGG